MRWILATAAVFFCALRLSASEPLVMCESVNGTYRECRVASSGKIGLARELSDGLCAEGATWGTRSDGLVWVTRGCRAMFFAAKPELHAKPAKAMAKTVTCESSDGARHHCEADTGPGVAMAKQMSDETCLIDKTWGFDEKGIWVDGGCRAQFILGGFRLPESAVPPTARRVVCEASDEGRHQCEINATRGVGLIRQKSEAPCVLNRTWGYDRNGIWVAAGCGAEFAVASDPAVR